MQKNGSLRVTLWVLALTFLAGERLACAGIPEVPPPPELEPLQAFFQEEIAHERVTSISVAVRREGKLLWAEAFGYRDREAQLPATANTLYPVASLSKPFTGALLLQLQERGLLKLDDPVNKYLPESPIDGNSYNAQAVTLRLLANHRAGLPPQIDMIFKGETKLDFQERIRRYGWLSYEPGRFFLYNNLSTEILAHVAEGVTGHAWRKQLREQILDPLAMTRTAEWARNAAPTDSAKRYCRGLEGDFVVIEDYEIDTLPAASIWSTPSEYTRFLDMVLAGGALDGTRVLAEKSAQAMLNPTTGASVRGTRSVSWKVDKWKGQRRISHAGGIPGVKSAAHGFLKDRIAIVLILNCDQDKLRRLYVKRLLTALVSPVEPVEPAGPDPASPMKTGLDLAALQGEWKGAIAFPREPHAIHLRIGEDGWLDINVEGIPQTKEQAILRPDQYIMGGNSALGSQLIFDIYTELPIHETYRGKLQMQFQLTPRGNRIEGAAIVSPVDYEAHLAQALQPVKRPQFQLPMRVRLERATAQPAAN